MPGLSERWHHLKDILETTLGQRLDAAAAGSRVDVEVPLETADAGCAWNCIVPGTTSARVIW